MASPWHHSARVSRSQVSSNFRAFFVATLQLAMLVGRFVGRLVSVSFCSIFSVFGRLLHYGSCPSACFTTAPAHPHAVSVAVYPALFNLERR